MREWTRISCLRPSLVLSPRFVFLLSSAKKRLGGVCFIVLSLSPFLSCLGSHFLGLSPYLSFLIPRAISAFLSPRALGLSRFFFSSLGPRVLSAFLFVSLSSFSRRFFSPFVPRSLGVFSGDYLSVLLSDDEFDCV